MSEEERKEEYKPKVVSYFAFVAGIATFLCGLLTIPYIVFTGLTAIIPMLEAKIDEGITEVFFGRAFVSVLLFWPIAIIGLILSIVTFCLEQDKRFRIRPLTLELAGIGFYIASLFIFIVFI